MTETWTDAIAEHTRWQLAAGFSKGTRNLRRVYIQRLAARVHPRGPWELTEVDLIEVLAVPQWAANTRHNARAQLVGFYTWAHRTGRVLVNPAADLARVKVPRGVPNPVPDEVFFPAWDAAEPRTRAMLAFAAYAGLRRGEIARVQRRDVTSNGLRVLGKGGVTRVVPVHPRLRLVLETLPPSGWLFPGQIDGHISADHVAHLVAGALGELYTTHMLRHRFASAAYAGTRDLRAVQELLGHSKPETTARYTAVPSSSLTDAVLAVS